MTVTSKSSNRISLLVFGAVFYIQYTYYIDRRGTSAYNIVMNNSKLTSDLLRGHTDTIILKLLLSGDKYGYEITKLVAELSGNNYELKEATLYSSFKRLEADNHIISYWGDESQGGRRKYYRITNSGRDRYKQNRLNWDNAKVTLEHLL